MDGGEQDVRFGVIGAYDVGLDHSDRRGRFSRLDAAASYARDDLVALLQMCVWKGMCS